MAPYPSARPKIEGSGILNGHTVAASEMSNCYLKKPLSLQFFSEQRQKNQDESKLEHVKIDNVSSDNVEVTTSTTFKHNIGSDVFKTNIPR